MPNPFDIYMMFMIALTAIFYFWDRHYAFAFWHFTILCCLVYLEIWKRLNPKK